MKIKDGFVLRKVSEAYVVVAVGNEVSDFNGMITLNETGAFLWENLTSGVENASELLEKMLAEYDVPEEVAKKDIEVFVKKLIEAKVLEL